MVLFHTDPCVYQHFIMAFSAAESQDFMFYVRLHDQWLHQGKKSFQRQRMLLHWKESESGITRSWWRAHSMARGVCLDSKEGGFHVDGISDRRWDQRERAGHLSSWPWRDRWTDVCSFGQMVVKSVLSPPDVHPLGVWDLKRFPLSAITCLKNWNQILYGPVRLGR